MTLLQLLDRVSNAYPDEFTRNYYNPDTGAEVQETGDTLAQFIVREIRDTYDPEESDEDQLLMAISCLLTAISDIQNVIEELESDQ